MHAKQNASFLVVYEHLQWGLLLASIATEGLLYVAMQNESRATESTSLISLMKVLASY